MKIIIQKEGDMMLFREVALEWFEKNRKNWVLKTQDMRLRVLEIHIFPVIGILPIKEIKSKHILSIAKSAENNGKTKLARSICQYARRIFSYGVVNDYCENNPASDILSECAKHNEKHYPFLPFHELTAFFNAINKNGRLNAQSKRAFLILFLTALRSQEVIKAKWSEIDLDKKIWIIPAQRMKMRYEHTVFLSDIVVELLKKQKAEYPQSDFVFPSPTKKNMPMNAHGLSRAIHHAGYGGRQVLHGFRHIFATHCYESNMWRDDAIECCLAHKIVGVRGVYNKAQYHDERKKIMQWYAKSVKNIIVQMM